jgi:hypothetical protein
MRHREIFFFFGATTPFLGIGLPPWNSPFHFGLLDLRYSVGLLGRAISSSQGHYPYRNTEKRTLTQIPNIHALSGIRNLDPGFRASEDSECLRPLGYRDGPNMCLRVRKLHKRFKTLRIKNGIWSSPLPTDALIYNVDISQTCKIWGFHGGDYDDYHILGDDTVWLL